MTWQTTTSLMPHQKPPIDKLIRSRVGALFMDMGLGKTRVAIEIAKLRQKKIDHVVWFCPVSLKETIRHEIDKHTNAVIYVFNGNTKTKNIPLADWYIIGIESMSASDREVLAARRLITDITFVIVDESTYIKGHKSIRTRRITALSEISRYRMILTGTPFTQGYEDLFSQMRFLSPKILGYRSFYSFAANHLEYHPKYNGMIVRALQTDMLAAKMQPYIYQVSKADAGINLPEKIYEQRYFLLSDQQEEWYNRAKSEILEKLEDYSDYFDSYVIFQLFTALQQIVSGFWNWGGEFHEFEQCRTNALLNTIHDIPTNEKVIIWFKYHYSIELAKKVLSTEYGKNSISEFHGGLSEVQRHKELICWRKSARFLLATQAAGGHGLTLNESSYAIFYENEFKYANRVQAEDRNHRIGQDRRPTYIDLVSDSKIDYRIMDALLRKGGLLEEFKREIDFVKNGRRDAMAKIKEVVKKL